MPPKISRGQPKIQVFARRLRSKHNSAPGSYMHAIEEEEEFDSIEESLPEDAGLRQVIDKLNEIGKRVETMEFAIFNQDTGLKQRVASQEASTETAHGKLLFMSKECKAVKHDIGVVKGLIQRQARQIDSLDSKVVDVTARGMAKNVVISGILKAKNEDPTKQVCEFLKQELNIPIDIDDKLQVKLAHRIGVPRKGSSRAMIAKVNQALRQQIYANIEDLAGRTNPKGEPFYLNFQQPEARLESKRNAKALLRKYQAKYKTAKVDIRGDKVYVNNEWQRPPVRAPQPTDLFFDSEEQKEMNKIKPIYTKPEELKTSSFWAAAVRVDTTLEVQRAYNKLRQESLSLDHISLGYVSKYHDEEFSGLVDDKEHGAGHKILRVIREKNETGIAVFVARQFGGEHIGPQRFEVISKLAKSAIEQLNRFTTPIPDRPPTSTSPKEYSEDRPPVQTL